MTTRIALDFDGVLADTHTATVELYNEYNNENVSVQEFTDWGFGGTPIEIDDYLEYSKRAWKLNGCGDLKIHPIPVTNGLDLEEIVYPLVRNDYMELDIVTARTKDNYNDVADWLIYWYGTHWYGSLIFEKEKHSLGYDIYIDDNPEMRHDVPVQYMPERPWNRTVDIEDMDNVYRMDSLESIVKHIQENRM